MLIPDAIGKEPRPLVDHLAERQVTRLAVVPSLLREILERCADLPRRLARLRYCFSSGEALSRDLAEQFRKVLPGCRLINLYGSSEIAGDVTHYEVGDAERGSTIPIGRPIANTQIYLLDSYLQPVPIGARGELCVGGDNLARGYLHRPELTAEKFIANPFDAQTVSRLYRSGDLARYRSDGTIEFLGRTDRQVKIRGCRVEPGEVEAALCAHSAVRECVVTIQSPESGTDNRKSRIPNLTLNDFLVAHMVSGNDRPCVAELRSFLSGKLPDYMIPSEFVFLERLPLLPNGKVDRAALALFGERAERVAAPMTEPRSEIENLIAAVWRRVLNLEKVGIHDNFFELGGHSLMAAEIAAKLRDSLGRARDGARSFRLPHGCRPGRVDGRNDPR